MDRLSIIASAKSSCPNEPTFVEAFDKAIADHHRVVFVGHSLGCVLGASDIAHVVRRFVFPLQMELTQRVSNQ